MIDEVASPMIEPSLIFKAVDWLRGFRLSSQTLLEDELEVTFGPDTLLPFANLIPRDDFRGFAPSPAIHAGIIGTLSRVELQEQLADLSPVDLSRKARILRYRLNSCLAAYQATASLRKIGGPAEWVHAAAGKRSWFLARVDAGMPPSARQVSAACRSVPHAMRHLGKALPTAEMIRLLKPMKTIVELGAGFGLFSRALERAGVTVVSTDPDESGNAGIGFPVLTGFNANETARLLHGKGIDCVPILMVWPHPNDGPWFCEVFERAARGQVIAMASPEFEFCVSGGLETAEAQEEPGPGWLATADLGKRLRVDFDELGTAPVVAAGWPATTTPLRLWRKR